MRSYRERWVQNVVQINRQQFEETVFADRLNRIARVIGVGPGICARCQTSIRQQIQNAFVRIQLRSQKYQMLQRVRQAVIVVCFGGCKMTSTRLNLTMTPFSIVKCISTLTEREVSIHNWPFNFADDNS